MRYQTCALQTYKENTYNECLIHRHCLDLSVFLLFARNKERRFYDVFTITRKPLCMYI